LIFKYCVFGASVESEKNNITIEELEIGELGEKEVSYEGIYNLVLFLIIIFGLLCLQYKKEGWKK